MAEEYHTRVVAAHKGHGKVEMPLPLLNGRPGGLARVRRPAEVELTEAELAGRAFRRPLSPPEPDSGNGTGNGNGSGQSDHDSDSGDDSTER